MIRILNACDFNEVEKLIKSRNKTSEEISDRVRHIINEVEIWGDQAVCKFTKEFDGVSLQASQLRVTEDEINSAKGVVGEEFLTAIRLAKENIVDYHRRRVPASWFEPRQDGVILGQSIRPIQRAGIYVPGGTAVLFSTVLMTALPAFVAGVPEIVMATPPGKNGAVSPYVLAAAAEAGVTEIYRMGGAQAIAALAYGTESVRPVFKIVGPGNVYVTMAKRQVYGCVDIDMLAGPSEILIVADSKADPVFIAADMLSQAEHDEMSSAVLITPDTSLAKYVIKELEKQLDLLPRREVALKSLRNFGAVIISNNLQESFELVNRLAPEHLELLVEEPLLHLDKINSAGAVFLGLYTPEAVGDYFAGPSHVLPTGSTARFASPLGVDTFLKRSSIIAYTRNALEKAGPYVIKMAEIEGLGAHVNSVRVRFN